LLLGFADNTPSRRRGAPATAIVAAAGAGERLGTGRPKAFVELGGRPLIDWSLDALRAAEAVGSIIVALPAGESLDGVEGVETVAGGPSRSESVAAALERVESEEVVVHDAARPLATSELFDAVLTILHDEDCEGVVAAARVTDTVKEVLKPPEVLRTLDRSSLWAAQTPQAFRTEALRAALGSTSLLAQATDDAMLVERLQRRVVVHEAPVENLKVTTPLDLRIAELLLRERSV
jgi:2-C-methyl-D-erythritol 4-phosphate cytidylyltransferase